MAVKLCKQQKKLFGNNVKYSDFIGSKIFLEKLSLKFLVSASIGIINMPEKLQKNRWSRSP